MSTPGVQAPLLTRFNIHGRPLSHVRKRAGGTHPTGMHSCFTCKQRREVIFPQFLWILNCTGRTHAGIPGVEYVWTDSTHVRPAHRTLHGLYWWIELLFNVCSICKVLCGTWPHLTVFIRHISSLIENGCSASKKVHHSAMIIHWNKQLWTTAAVMTFCPGSWIRKKCFWKTINSFKLERVHSHQAKMGAKKIKLRAKRSKNKRQRSKIISAFASLSSVVNGPSDLNTFLTVL